MLRSLMLGKNQVEEVIGDPLALDIFHDWELDMVEVFLMGLQEKLVMKNVEERLILKD